MKTTQLFSHFCAVQHRLSVSPRAAALFFFILGELSASGFSSYSIAMANSRICGTIHTSHAALRKCRDELIAAGIISFSSADGGKTLALYTLLKPENWLLDNVNVPYPESTSQPACSEHTDDATATGAPMTAEPAPEATPSNPRPNQNAKSGDTFHIYRHPHLLAELAYAPPELDLYPISHILFHPARKHNRKAEIPATTRLTVRNSRNQIHSQPTPSSRKPESTFSGTDNE